MTLYGEEVVLPRLFSSDRSYVPPFAVFDA